MRRPASVACAQSTQIGARSLDSPSSRLGVSVSRRCSVSTPRSSNRARGFRAHGSRTRHPQVSAHIGWSTAASSGLLLPPSPAWEFQACANLQALGQLFPGCGTEAPFLPRHYPASTVIRASPPPARDPARPSRAARLRCWSRSVVPCRAEKSPGTARNCQQSPIFIDDPREIRTQQVLVFPRANGRLRLRFSAGPLVWSRIVGFHWFGCRPTGGVTADISNTANGLL